MKKAVVLLSGGLDSATALYAARAAGYRCSCLVFDYGQRHRREIASARKIAQKAGCPAQVIKIALPWKGSSLLDAAAPLPAARAGRAAAPTTYVPGRNTIFLSFAVSYAEAIGAGAIYIGANAVDFSGYPDCRPQFYRAFSSVIRRGTKAGDAGRSIRIVTPLIRLTKALIVKRAIALGVPLGLTWSCYRGGRRPCGTCDSCFFRAKGFRQAGAADPLLKG